MLSHYVPDGSIHIIFNIMEPQSFILYIDLLEMFLLIYGNVMLACKTAESCLLSL